MKTQDIEKNNRTESVYNLDRDTPSQDLESNLQIKVVATDEEFLALESAWSELVDESEATIFQTFDWNRAWWKYFGTGKALYTITLYDEQRLMGILPLFVDTFTMFGRQMYSCLRFIGSIVSQPEGEDLKGLLAYSDYLDAIIRPGYEELFYTQVLGYLKLGCRLSYNEIILDEIPEQSSLLNHFLPVLDENGISYSVSEGSVCPVIKLEKTWDEYLANLSKRSRYHVRKFVKKANKNDYKVFDIERACDLESMLRAYEKLVELHQKRWNAIGYPGAFAEKRFYNFLSEATMIFWRKGWAELRLAKSIDEDPCIIAVDLLFKFKGETYLVHRAYDIESEFNVHGPGNVLLYQGVKDAIEEQHKIFDFLRGAEGYKFRSANDRRQNKVIEIVHPGKKYRLNSRVIKELISAKRRFKLELEQIHVVFKDKNIFRGTRDYCSFVYRRIMNKI